MVMKPPCYYEVDLFARNILFFHENLDVDIHQKWMMSGKYKYSPFKVIHQEEILSLYGYLFYSFVSA